MLKKRIFTALIGIPIAVFVINYGGGPFSAAVILLASIAWHEYSAMMKCRNHSVSYILGIIAILFILGCAAWGNPQELIFVIFVFTLTTLVKVILSQTSFSIYDAAFTVLGVMYIGLAFAYLLLLRFTDAQINSQTAFGSLSLGAVYLWLPFIGTWASDSFAFFVGSKMGKHKLCPAISPGKTVEGALGGLIGSVLGVAAAGYIFKFDMFHGIIIGMLVGIAAPLGDLVESAIKRFTGVKDSGRLLPGHGGVLDRFDSIMFAVPAVYYYIYVFIVG